MPDVCVLIGNDDHSAMIYQGRLRSDGLAAFLSSRATNLLLEEARRLQPDIVLLWPYVNISMNLYHTFNVVNELKKVCSPRICIMNNTFDRGFRRDITLFGCSNIDLPVDLERLSVQILEARV